MVGDGYFGPICVNMDVGMCEPIRSWSNNFIAYLSTLLNSAIFLHRSCFILLNKLQFTVKDGLNHN